MNAIELLENVRASRAWFRKHLAGLRDDQWDFRPFPDCNTIRETLAHLVTDDNAACQSLASGAEPDYAAAQVSETDRDRLLDLLTASHLRLLDTLTNTLNAAPEAELCIWGHAMPPARGIPYLSSEDYYHAGQVAFLRMASDPAWDYYAALYGATQTA